jgi:nucleoid-associated protein YejK
MAGSSKIKVHRMILHKIDRQLSKEGPIVSDVEPNLPSEVEIFVSEHIVSSKEDTYARNGAFTPSENSDIVLKDVCDAIFDTPNNFVEYSKVIAKHLFDTMERPGKPSPSDLIVCLYSEEGSKENWLGILKMDPSEGFVSEEKKDAKGLKFYELRRVNDVIVSTDLQKSALIAPPSLRSSVKYDLRLLDNQQSRSGINRIAASFFVTDFLQCRVGLNAADKTRVLLLASEDWISDKTGKWSDEEIEEARTQITNAALGRRVNITSLAQNITAEENEQDNFVDYLRSKGIDESTFQPDPHVSKQMTTWTILEGDYGIRLSVRSDLMSNRETFEKRYDDATNTWIVTIRTANLRTKTRSRAN